MNRNIYKHSYFCACFGFSLSIPICFSVFLFLGLGVDIFKIIFYFFLLFIQKLQVNMDIVFPRMPCHLLSVDIQDIVGSHSMNVGGNLFRRRIDKNGKTISDELHVLILLNKRVFQIALKL